MSTVVLYVIPDGEGRDGGRIANFGCANRPRGLDALLTEITEITEGLEFFTLKVKL